MSRSMSKKMNILSICFSALQATIYMFISLVPSMGEELPLAFYTYMYILPGSAILCALLGIKHDLNNWAWISLVMSYVVQFLLGVVWMIGI